MGDRRFRPGVRARILGTVLALTTIAMLSAGALWVVVQRAEERARVDSAIEREVAEFVAFAAEAGATPAGADVTALLRAAIQRQVPAADQTYLGVVGGRAQLVPAGERPVRPEAEPALMRVVSGLPADAPIRTRQVATSAGPVRFAAVPVRVAGRPEQGVYVVAFALAPGNGRILDGARQYAAFGTGALVLVGLAGWLVAGRLLLPLRLLRETAEDISHTDLTRRIPVEGRDDVSDLTRTVNAMLDRLQEAFEAQQQFLDDAGHELRTPVTVIRGHLELVDPADPADVTEVRDLALDELDRMGRLIGDLMLLAKARRPDFVRPGPVELARLTDEVAEKAAALGPRRWVVDAHADVAVPADAQRLTQALLQLADNAVRHTVDGDEIGIGTSVTGREARLWVRDTGPGVAAEDAAVIFERFRRGSAPGPGGEEGSGLGLAIVGAIAGAHGGRVELSTPPGGGALFTLVLPLDPRATVHAETVYAEETAHAEEDDR